MKNLGLFVLVMVGVILSVGWMATRGNDKPCVTGDMPRVGTTIRVVQVEVSETSVSMVWSYENSSEVKVAKVYGGSFQELGKGTYLVSGDTNNKIRLCEVD